MKYVLVLLCFAGVAVAVEDTGLSICPGNYVTHFTTYLKALEYKIELWSFNMNS